MSSYFEGEYKGRKQISLGGKRGTNQKDAKETLRAAQLQRERREMERRRLRSAGKIQAVWRGYRRISAAKDEFRKEWDRNWESGRGLSNVSIRYFVFFFDKNRDDDWNRFLLLGQRLLSASDISLGVRTLWNPLLSASQTHSDIEEFMKSIRLLISFCLRLMNSTTLKYIEIADLLFELTDSRTFSYLSQVNPKIDSRFLSDKIISHLQKENYLKSLRNGLNSADQSIGGKILKLSTQPFQSEDSTDANRMATHISEFINHILSFDLSKFLSNDDFLLFSTFLPLYKILETICKLEFPEHSILPLLANVVSICTPQICKTTVADEILNLYVSANFTLLSRIDRAIFKKKTIEAAESDSEDNESDHDLPILQLDSNIVSMKNQILVSVDQKTLIVLSRFFKQENKICKLAELLATYLSIFSEARESILNTVVFRYPAVVCKTGIKGFVKILLDALRKTELIKSISNVRIRDSIFSDPKYASEWGLFIVIAEVLNRLLLMTGDDELFAVGSNHTVSIEDVIEVSTLLRNVSVHVYWNTIVEKVPGTVFNSSHINSLFSRVLSQIHSRDCRRQFCPPDHWIVTSVIDNPQLFVSAAVAENIDDVPSIDADEDVEMVPDLHPKNVKNKITGPRMAVLRNIPFVVPFETRVLVFREFVMRDRMKNGLAEGWIAPSAIATIRRDHMFEDGFTYLNALGKRLKRRIQITFVNEQGLTEAGIDGGGVFKEFLTGLSQQAFNENYGLFQATNDQMYYPSSHSYARQEQQLKYFEFVGRILGKALYEGILLDVGFASFFLSKWLGKQSYLDDLPSLDPEVYANLIKLKNYEGDIGDLGLTFTVDDEEFGKFRSIDLIPNGSNIEVTSQNRLRYIFLLAHYKLNTRLAAQCQAFFRGLSDLISASWLRIFSTSELQTLLSGSTSAKIDVDDWMSNTVYVVGFDEEHETVQMFWRVVRNMSDEEQRMLLKFATSCRRPPLLGFKELVPKFSLRCAVGEDESRLRKCLHIQLKNIDFLN